RYVAFQVNALSLRVGVRNRDRRKQRLGIGMVGRLKEAFGAADLDQLAQVYDGDDVRQVADHRQIVRDKQVGGLAFVLKLGQQVQDRRLHGDVQRRHRLVAHDQFRLRGKGAGNGDSLLLAAAQLVRVAAGVVTGQVNGI